MKSYFKITQKKLIKLNNFENDKIQTYFKKTWIKNDRMNSHLKKIWIQKSN